MYVFDFRCSLIALGNGTACRETEEWLTELIKRRFFYPSDVKYTIVSEDGASIYSCSAEARKEFPKLDTNIISAGTELSSKLKTSIFLMKIVNYSKIAR